ncbi:MAG: tetratricopeptide repeat protein [Candidatus Hodarchaeota archaeon]
MPRRLTFADQFQRAEQLLLQNSFDEALQLVETLDHRIKLDEEEQVKCKLLKSQILAKKGIEEADLDRASDYLQQSMELKEELGDHSGLISVLGHIGSIALNKGYEMQATKSFQRMITICQDFDNQERLAWVLNMIGNIYGNFGVSDQALEYFQRSFSIFRDLDKKLGIAYSLTCLGWIYLLKGELERALSYLHQSEAIHEEINEPGYAAWAFVDLAIIYRAKGDLEKTFEYATKGYALGKEARNAVATAWTLYLLTIWALDRSQYDSAESYSRQLQIFCSKTYPAHSQRRKNSREARLIGQLSLLAEGRLLKASPRLLDKMQAQDLFQQVAEDEPTFFGIISDAMFNWCELLLFELSVTREWDVFREAKTLVQQFVVRAHQQHFLSSVVDALIVQAKLALVEGDLMAAEEFLDQAKTAAEEKGLSRLIKKAAIEKQRLQDQQVTWQALIQTNAPFEDRLAQAQLREYLKEALRIVYMSGNH